ncbi:TIGR02584 family CRISPR-associated protein [Vibrio cholerae]|uniref:CRISPR-associated ring nuclease Csm6 n=1 Tax=Vibrio cholerae TaxID=666 RepID=UPI00115A1C5D|nr:CRISPR-associated ring nuclease Csm6 [Vibrio cholerae]EJL6407452.1 TIGR02584 family CRISPR-associated protein [Vibrio cholerae]EJL6707371.1 TIGR02584 family CRISPR-associated protein [Vibrio cholerae]EJL9426495.1 TIGR02584 family CRISPR-associated protein [Vibrio cholerae]EKF9878253.1 TIGR02584 family CRISPR-associated protein [Vibrio cholerae]TQO70764.1 TIGR02584 family CRISPR-associated protein [Vibrio cholerae]
MKNILLATTGANPQVLTETLYAIHQSGKAFPEEIFVITTLSNKKKLMEGLFEQGHLQALKDEYNLTDFTFDESHIWLIEDENGEPIDDAKSIEDQTYMADFITRKVFELTQDENTAIHASLAGGRKTMAFYFGYAMSLLGREQDTLSHVFVDDRFENVRDFWYPTKQRTLVKGKNGEGSIDLSEATVTLAEIPFVRMRKAIDPTLLSSMVNLSFSQTVGMLNASQSDQLKVTVNKPASTIEAVGVTTSLTPKETAFYLWLLSKNEEGVVVDRGFEENTQNSIEFLKTYSELASDPRVYKTFNTTPEDFIEGDDSTLKGMERTFVQTQRSNINRKLKKSLPTPTAAKLEIISTAEGTDTRYLVASCQSGCVLHIVE